jgi:hypothetical protein
MKTKENYDYDKKQITKSSEIVLNPDDSDLSYVSTKRNKIIYILFFTITLVLLEYFLRDFLKYINSFFNSYNVSDCKNYEYFEFYELSGRYFLLYLVYNMVNVYAALSFIFLDSIGVFINGLIRFLYLDPRPFWENAALPPCFCAIDYGNPSTTSINLFILFATLYKAFTYNNRSQSKRIFFWIIGSLVIVYTSVIRVFQNIHYIHQLLYGLGIGYIIFYVFFEIFEVDFDDEKQFYIILTNPLKITIIFTLLYFLSNIIHVILNLQPRTEFIEIVSKSCKINRIFAFDNESYTKSTRIFEFLGYFYGVWLEYLLIFGQNYSTFTRYNLVSKYSRDKFNDTDYIRTIFRITLMYLGHVIIVSRLILSKYVNPPNESIVYSIGMRLIIPYFFEGIFNFFILKSLMRHLRITNEHIFRFDLEICDQAERLLADEMKNTKNSKNTRI